MHSQPAARTAGAGLRALASAALLVLLNLTALAQAGDITGHVNDKRTGEPLPSVNVVVRGTQLGAATGPDGSYLIRRVPAGAQAVVFSMVGHETVTKMVQVREDAQLTLDVDLTDVDVLLSGVSVYGASLKQERITEAPAAVSVIDAAEIRLSGHHGQLPRLLEAQPGVDIVQSGIQDFNINTRGFNSSLNRRLLVLLDGRDLAIAFLGAQEWNGLSVPLEDLGRLELVRGPGSALYGPNAFNGVVNVTTPQPKDILGSKLSFSYGELNMARTDLRQAGLLGSGWSYKANFGTWSSLTWSKSRTAADLVNGDFEYPGLVRAGVEQRPLNSGPIGSTYGSMRFDYNYSEASFATIEGGMSQVQNETFVTGIGRVQVTKANKPWGRLNYTSERFNAMVWAQGRSSVDPQYSLLSGVPLQEQSAIYHAEAQYNFWPVADQLRVIVGASHRLYHVDTEGTLMADARWDNTSGIFAQAEFSPLKQLKLVAATRWDRSTLHADQFSPKGAVVLSFDQNHSLRATVNKAFQVPNYSEFFLRAAAGVASLPFFASPLNPTGATPILARGNPANSVETILGYEVGYKGVFFDNSVFITLDGYYNQAKNFVTDLLQGVNPEYPFRLPPGFPAGLADVARNAVPGLTIVNGAPAIVVSYTNAGKVDERGIEFGARCAVTSELEIDGSWTWYDFEVKEQQLGDVLIPNAPKHKFSLGAAYRSPLGFDVALSGRNVQPYHWAAGIFDGEVPAYTLLNVAAGWNINKTFRVSTTVSNVLDHEVYQVFGGSLIGRQAIGTMTVSF